MFLLKLLPCIKASFSSFSSSFLKAWYFFDVQTSELKSDNSFTPVPILIAIYAIFPPNQDQFFQRVGGYENIEIVERIHLKIFKYMYILNIKSCTPLSVFIYSRMVSNVNWAKFFSAQKNKVVHILY